ncbi:DUF4336 domain-containing protein [Pannus brasiliensis CCIBt3594]|uniref:DUF4336 domain-containing protein n=1 Tax=Pannus brasiliensis CCIBt3594 TaxID=1427578 RepID=A0AAW9QUI6_9CHRO
MNQTGVRPQDLSWPYWPIVPLYPYGRRWTIRREVVKDTIWTFDQIQGIFYVVVPIRMTVIRLESGGLLVYAPVAPTNQCIALVRELEARYGEVKYIILPTISGIEHKVFVGPFARRFPSATVYVAPDQWSFPLNLPSSWLGLPARRTEILPQDVATTPLHREFDYEILRGIDLNGPGFSEVAFFHRASNTLLVTDSIVSVPEDPPEIVRVDPYPLLFHARDSADDPILDSPKNRRKGWQRICLFALYFQPPALEVLRWGKVFREARTASDRSRKGYFGLFPFQWRAGWRDTFETLRGGGRLLVAPILQTLILNRSPEVVLQWVDRVASWEIKRVIPCHFEGSIETDAYQFRQAFSFLEKTGSTLPDEDLECLRGIDRFLIRWNITPPPREKL